MTTMFLNSVKLSETGNHHTSPWSDSGPEELILGEHSPADTEPTTYVFILLYSILLSLCVGLPCNCTGQIYYDFGLK